jgi:hypothetical protein
MSERRQGDPPLRLMKANVSAFFDVLKWIWRAFGIASIVIIFVITSVMALIVPGLVFPAALAGVTASYIIFVVFVCWKDPMRFVSSMWHSSLAKAYQEQGLWEAAEELANSMINPIEADDASNNLLGMSQLQLIYIRQGKLGKAQKIAENIYELESSKRLQDDLAHEMLPYHMNTLAAINSARGSYSDAFKLITESKRQLERDERKRSPAYGTVLIALGEIHSERHEFAKAREALQEYYQHWFDMTNNQSANRNDELVKTDTADKTDIALYWLVSGRLLRYEKKYEQAEKELLEGVKIMKDEALQRRKVLTLPELLWELGYVTLDTGRIKEAESYFDRAVTYYKKRTVYIGPALGDALAGLAYARFKLNSKNKGDTKADLERALKLKEAELVPEHPSIAKTLTYFADVHAEEKNFEEAEKIMERAMSIYTNLYGADDRESADSRVKTADLYEVMNSNEDARQAASAKGFDLHGKAIALYREAMDSYRKMSDVSVDVINKLQSKIDSDTTTMESKAG